MIGLIVLALASLQFTGLCEQRHFLTFGT